jgi:hypothetical protein
VKGLNERNTKILVSRGRIHEECTSSFWNVASCSLVEVDRRFSETHCLHFRNEARDKKTVNKVRNERSTSSATYVNLYHTTWRHILQRSICEYAPNP